MTDKLDAVVVGAGVVGLAIARALALAGRNVTVLERNAGIGMETSSRNSEVIHAGIYYPPGTMKARFCVDGKRRLYQYCRERGIPHNNCGKLIVASKEEQHSKLHKLAETAEANGVMDIKLIDGDKIMALEPEVRGSLGLFSPSSGIVDSHTFMLTLQGDLESAGGIVVLGSELERVDPTDDGFLIHLADSERFTVFASLLVNSAGLSAQSIAAKTTLLRPQHIPPLHLAKGNYFALSGKSPFRHLIYPVPGDGGLGIHATIDLAGRTRFGPDVQWVDDLDYAVDASRGDVFYSVIREYWSDLQDGQLVPDYAGIRPKVERPGGSATDFVIHGHETHGIPGLVNLFGIESPGLTASLAIADYVTQRYAR
ncbi:MAG: NAD(P)/FAD-dependent oxidoreductase [Aestuariivirga sp.]